MAAILLIIRPPLSLAVPETAYPTLRMMSDMTTEAIGNQVLAGHVVRDGLTTILWRCLMVRQSRPRLREITENRDDDSHLRTQG